MTLKNGSRLERRADSFMGMPSDPVSRDDLGKKFKRLTAEMNADWQDRVLDGLFDLENSDTMAGLL